MNGAVGDRECWYSWSRFRLVPRFWYRRGDRFNRDDWGGSWLCLSVWSSMTLGFSASVEVGIDAWVQINVLYHHIRFHVPILPSWFHQKLWRVKKWQPEPDIRGMT